MNRLWVRLTLAFGLVSILSLIIISGMSTYLVSSQFRRFVADNQLTSFPLPDYLAGYYVQHGSWANVDAAFQNFEAPPPNPNAPPAFFHPNYILSDSDGRIIHGRGKGPGQRLAPEEQARAIAIEVEGKPVGYLTVRVPERGELQRPEQTFLKRISSIFLGAGIIAGGMGIALGLILSRSLTAPLSKLAAAAHEISQGKLGKQVPVEGPKEVADLTAAFNDMSSDLAEAETLRRNMVADVAHELRTPLTVLQGNLRAILDDVYALDKSEIARLYDQTGQLSRLVNDLRELAQAEAHQLKLNLQPVDPRRLVTAGAEKFAPLTDANEILLTTEFPTNTPTIQADSARLTQALDNLLVNALRHTPAGGSIAISLALEANAVALSVADTGEGIPPEHLPHVFNRFYRTDPARSRDTGNAGLGLAIAKAIVEEHGGSISVASDGVPGRGTTFTVRLPYVKRET